MQVPVDNWTKLALTEADVVQAREEEEGKMLTSSLDVLLILILLAL